MRKFVLSITAGLFALGFLNVTPANAGGLSFEITFTNITKGIVLTPPIFATTKHHSKIDLFEVGKPASEELSKIAEGGNTDDLAALLEEEGALDVVQTEVPVFPGESITVKVHGRLSSRLFLASMLLPTNDGFVAIDGEKLWGTKGQTFYLRAYDAGTEVNDEVCANIPGPQCDGDGFSEDPGEGYIFPHPGIHGEAELTREAYNWTDPVAKVFVKLKY